MALKSRREKDDISICEPISKIEFIISSENKIKIEAFGGDISKVSNKAGIGSMIDFFAQLFIFLEYFSSDDCDITHM